MARPTRAAGMMNGAADEARSYANAIINQLSDLSERVDRGLVRDQYAYVTRTMTVDAAATAVEDFVTPPPGTIWIVERWAVTSGPVSGFAIYLNEAQPQNLLDGEFADADMAARGVDNGLYVPAGSRLILRFYAQPPNQVCSVNLRVREITENE